MTGITLRPYQADLDRRIDAHRLARPDHNICMVLPTGGGKTAIVATRVKKHVGASICIAHRNELVGQLSMALARSGIRHRILADEKVVRAIIKQHIEKYGTHFHYAAAQAGVAGVMTLLGKRVQKEHGAWLAEVTLAIPDECFPAGTNIDGRPIEDIRVGDWVRAFNEHTGEIESHRVVRLFKNPAPKHMVRITTAAHHVLSCTPNHPFWTKRGWVPAGSLSITDEVLDYGMPRMQCPGGPSTSLDAPIPEERAGLLLEGMFERLPCESLIGNYDADQSGARLGPYENEQSDGETRSPRKNESDPTADRACTVAARGQWPSADFCRNGSRLPVSRSRVSTTVDFANRRTPFNVSSAAPLQDRLRESDSENSNRGGRIQSLRAKTTGPRPSQDSLPKWVGLDSIEIYEPANSAGYGNCTTDGYVYNFEVEGLHTYLADGLVVHNCHHVLRENTWGKALALTPKAHVFGVTAWPGRTDGKGIGRHAHGVFDVIIAGPSMPELIRMGYLAPFRVFCPRSDFRREDLEISKATGEFTAASTAAAVGKSTITGDCVTHYQRIVPGKTAFVFAPDVATADKIAGRFNGAGIRAAMLDGNTEVGLRIKTMQAFERREFDVVANVALFGEGTDIPNLDAAIMADPTQSYCKFTQEAGRPARLSIPDAIYRHWETYTDEERRAFIAASDKPFGYLIDMVGNVKQHGLPGARTDYSLDNRERGGKGRPADVMPTKMCSKCTGEYEAIHSRCPYCAEVQVPASRSGPKFVDGDLFELDLSALQGLQKLVREANDAPAIPAGVSEYAAQGIQNKHYEKLQARAALKEMMALWAGWRQAEGDTPSMAQRRFFFQFGHDVMTAQTLNRADSQALNDKLRAVLTRSSVRSSVPLVHNEELTA